MPEFQPNLTSPYMISDKWGEPQMVIGGSPSQNSAAFSRTFLIGLENGGSAPPSGGLRLGQEKLSSSASKLCDFYRRLQNPTIV